MLIKYKKDQHPYESAALWGFATPLALAMILLVSPKSQLDSFNIINLVFALLGVGVIAWPFVENRIHYETLSGVFVDEHREVWFWAHTYAMGHFMSGAILLLFAFTDNRQAILSFVLFFSAIASYFFARWVCNNTTFQKEGERYRYFSEPELARVREEVKLKRAVAEVKALAEHEEGIADRIDARKSLEERIVEARNRIEGKEEQKKPPKKKPPPTLKERVLRVAENTKDLKQALAVIDELVLAADISEEEGTTMTAYLKDVGYDAAIDIIDNRKK